MSRKIGLLVSIILVSLLWVRFFKSSKEITVEPKIKKETSEETQVRSEEAPLTQNLSDTAPEIKQTEQTKKPRSKSEVNPKVINIDFDQIKSRIESNAEAPFAKSYKLVVEDIMLTSRPQRIQVNFDHAVKDVTSVVIMGKDGENKIQNLQFNNKSLNTEAEPKTLFPNDWYRSEHSFPSLQSFEFTASAKDLGSLNIYLQVVGEE